MAVDTISLREYDRFLSTLIDLQLQFEELARLAPFIDDERLAPPTRRSASPEANVRAYVSLTKAYEDIESYLNEIVDEYEICRQCVMPASVAGESFPMTRLPKLEALKQKDNFRPGMANHMGDIRKVLQVALLEPIKFRAPQIDDVVADASDVPMAAPRGMAHSS